ncbi:DUF6151 family protein [Aurantiacibacter sp. MUD61]|uniref:DUF6151 family protein n=1 Tax=Aurantiacibacter sp. MUD61 TaxID=3009083 RepID=UPI0022F04619|nr:DUF6151 family protein [Aurantiacibacter sp. MUD61]
MIQRLEFRCKCGAVGGTIDIPPPVDGEVIVCHCTDCRDFVRLCGKSEIMLDDLGGVSLFNFRGSRLHFSSGLEQMRCLHMTEKPVLRWVCSCCDTPMFNSFATTRIPFLDIFTATIKDISPLRGLTSKARHLFPDSATGDASDLPASTPAGLILRTTPRIVREYVSGGRKANPLFDAKTGEPIAVPRRVSQAERAAIE